ncbi:sigma-70 RNA polymerase sigma factor region 4 domain-containing protein [Singulisphaera rosea]
MRRWRVPPHWSRQQWIDELRAEGIVAAALGRRSFRPELNVPLHLYLRMRVLGRVLARHRAEWRYARLVAEDVYVEDVEGKGDGRSALVPHVDLQDAMALLSRRDRELLEQIYWKGESELTIASQYGVTQQAINKRKRAIIAVLRRRLK